MSDSKGPTRQHHRLASGKGLTPEPKGSTLSEKQSFGPGTVKTESRKSSSSTGSSGKGGY